MKNPWHKMGFALIKALSYLPFEALYIVSDVLYLLVRYVVRYRYKVVCDNINTCFPECTAAERKSIINDFYRYFCDYMVETIKMATISFEDMKRHMSFEGVDAVKELFTTHDFVFVYLGHYANWEWVSSLGLWFDKDIIPAQLYKPIHNQFLDEVFLHIRSRFGNENIDKNQSLRRIMEMKREQQKSLVGFISDQSPKERDIHAWMDFLHRDTPLFTGAERIGKKINAAFVYLDIRRVKRGYYCGRFDVMTEDARNISDWQLSEDFMHRFERTIMRDPACWLWSHKRWKYQRPTEDNKPS